MAHEKLIISVLSGDLLLVLRGERLDSEALADLIYHRVGLVDPVDVEHLLEYLV